MGRASRRRRAALRPEAPEDHLSQPPRLVGSRGVASFDVLRSLDRLAVIREERRMLDREVASLVNGLAAAGVSWGDIGRALDMTRQGARQHYLDRLTGSGNDGCRLD